MQNVWWEAVYKKGTASHSFQIKYPKTIILWLKNILKVIQLSKNDVVGGMVGGMHSETYI
jgi:hypothetical protein